MKNNKWLIYTLGILLTLVVLAAVAGAGFRFGMIQNTSFAGAAFMHNVDGGPKAMHGDFDGQGGPQKMQGDQGFDNRGNNRGNDRRGGGNFFAPIFGLIHFALLGLLGWFGYKYVKNSGWKFVRTGAAPVTAESETVSTEVDEKKESE